jgi:DNA-binding response OmpR family regulator
MMRYEGPTSLNTSASELDARLASESVVWASGATSERPRVLVVDDDVSLARILSFVLSQEGFDVKVANDGDDAIEAAKIDRPDAVVLDLRMPGKDGRAVFKELRELGIDSPVLILSAFDAQRAYVELGAQAYMNKPFEPERLAEAVRRLLEPQP